MESNKKVDKRKRITQMLIAMGVATAVSTGVSIGITYAIASKQLKLPSYNVTFKNYDGTILQQEKVQIGSDAKYTGQTPVKPTENYVDYAFTGWDRELTNIIADREIFAQFEGTRQTYTMTWYDEDGTTIIDTKTCYKDEIAQGDYPITEKVPSKATKDGKQYIFNSWKYDSDQGWKTGSFKAKAVYDQAQEGLTISDGVITGYSGSETSVTIPEIWAGKPVTTIGTGAFTTSNSNNTAIVSINIPKTITLIQEGAFKNATSLKTVTFDANTSIDTIYENTFSGCSAIESFTLPDNIVNVKNRAFYNCSNLTNLHLGKSISQAGFNSGSLIGCNKLASVTISSENQDFTVLNDYPGMIFSKDQKILIRCCPAATFSGQLPNTVEVVTSLAFQGCTKIGEVSFASCESLRMIDSQAFAASSITSFNSGDNIEVFGEDIFKQCTNLTKITLGANVSVETQWDSFSGCDNLAEIEISEDNEYMCSYNGMVYDKPASETNYTLLRCPTACPVVDEDGNSTISPNCTIIGDSAFQGCTQLNDFTVPEQIITINSYAFTQCPNLTKITLGTGNLSTIGEKLFNSCSALKTINIGSDMAFSSKLNAGAWAGCSNIESITVDSSNTWFKSVDDVLYGYDGQNAWLLRYPPAKSGTTFNIPETVNFNSTDVSVAYLGRLSISDATQLETIKLPSSILKIYPNAFENCSKLSSLILSSGLKLDTNKLGDNIFKDCENLTSVTLYDATSDEKETIAAISSKLNYQALTVRLALSSQTITEDAFMGSDSIKKVIIDNYPTTIGKQAFRSCTKLTEVELPSSVLEIGDYAFCEDTALTKVNLPSNLESIGNYAFQDCPVEDLVLPSTVKTIGSAAFMRCEFNSTVDLTNVTSAGSYAFAHSYKITNIILPKQIELGNNCFTLCSALTTVTYNGTIEEFHSNIRASGLEFSQLFKDCNNLHQITCSDGFITKS